MSEKRDNVPSMPVRRGPGGPGRPGGPGGPFMEKVKPKDGKGTLLRLTKYLSSKALLLAGVLLFCLISTLVSIFGTQINGQVLDDYVMAGNLSGLGIICLVLLGIYLVGVVCSYFQNTLMVELSNRTIALIRRDLFAKVGRLPLAYFDTHSSGDLMSRLTNDIDNIGMTLSQGVAQLFGGVTMIVGVLVAMLIESPLLTLFGMLTVPLMFLLTRLLAHFSRRYFKRQSKDLGELNGYIEESISGQKTVKLFSHEEQAKKEFDAVNQRLRRSGLAAQAISGCMGPFMNFINNLSYLVVAVAGGYLILTESNMTVGVVFVFITYMKNFARPLSEIANLFNLFQSALAGAERVFEVMDEPKETDLPKAQEVGAFRGDVAFQDVCFSYIPGKPVLKHASISVKKVLRLPLLALLALAKPLLSAYLPDFTIKTADKFSLTERPLKKSLGIACGGMSAWCCRTPICFLKQCGRIFAMAVQTPVTSR